MDTIPDEEITNILNNLDLPQLSVCNLVCKRFKFIINYSNQFNMQK